MYASDYDHVPQTINFLSILLPFGAAELEDELLYQGPLIELPPRPISPQLLQSPTV